jgi:hypothetical protein
MPWYCADVKEACWYYNRRTHRLRKSGKVLVRTNTYLIRATDAEEAFSKVSDTDSLGYDEVEEDSAGLKRMWKFLGVTELTLVAEPLRDGCELFYSERYIEARKLMDFPMPKKRQLSVFRKSKKRSL